MSGVQEIKVTVKGGYAPDVIVVKKDVPVRLNFYRDETSSCSEQVVFGDFGIARDSSQPITTDRLIMRGYCEDDVQAIAALHGDPEVVRYLTPNGEPEPSLADAWDHIAKHLGHWVLKGYGKWAVDERETGRFVGRVTSAAYAGAEQILAADEDRHARRPRRTGEAQRGH